jgi:FHA domain-containing protein
VPDVPQPIAPDDRRRTARTLLIADHIWDAYATMAEEMGSEREALVNQALYTFARLNGFLLPTDLRPAAPAAPGPRSVPPPPREEPFDAGPSQATSMELPNLSQLGLVGNEAPRPVEPVPAPEAGRSLVLLVGGKELERVARDRFLIGRGKHCDLVINSAKVSREHAVITREGSRYFIEDLGSSNGTWFDKRRIARREIGEGDEYYVCSEQLICTFR